MKVITLVFIALVSAPLAVAGEVCSQEQWEVIDEAKVFLTQNYSDVLKQANTNGVGIGLCQGGAVESGLRTKPTPSEIVSGNYVCGISINFVDEAGIEFLSAWLQEGFGPGSMIDFTSQANQYRIPVCGAVIGEIGPQPGGTVSN